MKPIELLKLFRSTFISFLDNGIRMEDVRHIDLYDDYSRLTMHGEKVTYVVSLLADRYDVSERTVYNIVSRLGRDCSPGSLQ